MSPSLFHDAVFLGGGTEALLAAALCRRSGHQVMWLGQGDKGPFYRSGGMTLSAQPDWLPPYGAAPLLDGLLQELGLEDPVHRLGQDEGRFQLITPEERIDLFSEAEALAAELRRARVEDAEALLSLVARLQELKAASDDLLAEAADALGGSWAARWKLRRQERRLEEFALSPRASWPWLLKVLATASEFFCHLELETQPLWISARWVCFLLGGLRPAPNLRPLLAEALGKAGGMTRPEGLAEQIALEPGNLLVRAEAEHRCRALVSGLWPEQLAELFPFGKLRRELQRTASGYRRQAALFYIDLVLPTEALPLGMAQKVLLVPRPAEPLQEDNLLVLCRHPLAGRKEREQVQVFCRLSTPKRNLGRTVLAELQQKMMAAVARLIPFLSERMENLSSPFWEARGEDEPHPDPWGLHPLLQIEDRQTAGFCEELLHAPGRRLWFAGPELFPGLGLEGAALNARLVARRLSRLSGQKG